MPHQYGKRYRELATQVDKQRLYDPQEAVKLVRETSPARFDATVEAHIRLGVDPRHADQMVRSSALLPHGTGRTRRIAVFATGEKVREALDAGADIVGGEDLVKKVQNGEIDFDVALATPDIMGQVGRLGKILGPRGMMPNPKSGTVTFDIAKAVRDVQGGRVEFRVDRFGIVHVPIGKVSFDENALHQNLTTLVDALIRNKPSASKGQYLRTFFLTSTQGPSVPVDVREAAKLHVAG